MFPEERYMDKEEKEVLKFILKRELSSLKEDEKSVRSTSPVFLKSLDKYEHILKNLLKKVE